LTPEEQSRQNIDAQLTAAGWVVQSLDQLNLSGSLGVAKKISLDRFREIAVPLSARQIGRSNRLRHSELSSAFSGKF